MFKLGLVYAYTLIHSLTLSSCIPALREPEYLNFWCLFSVSLLDHFQGLEFSDSIVRSEPSWSFLPPAITFCIFLSHWLAIFFHISASYFFMYLFLCCYLSLLTGLFILINQFKRQGLKDATAKSRSVKDTWRETQCRDIPSSDLSKSCTT